MSKVYISAGHSGPGENGAIGLINERTETIALVNALQKYIQAKESKAICDKILFVSGGATLVDRIKQVNKWCGKDGTAIEIHFNSVTNQLANGTECMISAKAGAKTKLFAENLTTLTADTLHTLNRGVKTDNLSGVGYLGFVSKTKPTAVILEPIFVKNKGDIAAYRAHFDELVAVLSEVIINLAKA